MSDKVQVTSGELNIDVTKALANLDALNAKYGASMSVMREQEKQLKQLQESENNLLQARKKSNNPTVVAQYDKALADVRSKISDVNKSLQENITQLQKAAKEAVDLGTKSKSAGGNIQKAFDATKMQAFAQAAAAGKTQIDKVGASADSANKKVDKIAKKKVEFKGDVNKFLQDLNDAEVPLAKQIKRLQAELLKLDESSPEYAKLKDALTQLKDDLGDFKSDIAANVGEPLERVQGNISNLVQSLFTLDFKSANKALSGLAKSIKDVKTTDVIKGIRSLGKNVIELGKALLSNPLFLLATVIVYIIVNFEKLKKMGGPIGEFFRAIGRVVGVVIDALKALSDWIGVTNYAFEKQQQALQDTIEAYDKLIEKQREAADQQEAIYESERRLAISQIRDAKERNKALEQLDEELYLNKLNNRFRDTQNLKEQLALQRQQLEANAEQNAELLGFLEGKNKTISSITYVDNLTRAKSLDFESPLLEGFKPDEEMQKQLDKMYEIQKQIRQNEVNDTVDANNFFARVNERANQLREEQQKKWEEYLKNRTRLFEDEGRKLRRAQVEAATFDINQTLQGTDKVKALYKLQRDEIMLTAEEDKKAAKAVLNKADYRLYELEVAKRVTVQLTTLIKQQAQAELEEARRVADAKAEYNKQTAEYDIQLEEANTAGVVDVYDARFKAVQDFYDAKVAAALAAGKVEDAMLLSREGDVALAQLRRQRLLAQIEANRAALDEETRHSLAMLDIAGATQSEILIKEIAYEKQRLEQMQKAGNASQQELVNQQNKIIELEAKKNKALKDLDEERVKSIREGIQATFAATVQATTQLLSIQLQQLDNLREAQQQRVNDARDIASSGNAELLELEEKRLADLNKKRERFVRAQQALAAAELVANSAVAIAKAAAQGGVAAPFTIAATLLALIAGLAQARAVASQAAFYSGGLYDGQGYTGNGNPRSESTALGRKPYIYHQREFIFNHQTTGKNLDIFKGVHAGKIDLRDWQRKAAKYDQLMQLQPMAVGMRYLLPATVQHNNQEEIREELVGIRQAIKEQERMTVMLTEKGLAITATKYISKQNRVNKLAR
jgi:hypothetical protein